MIECFLLDFLKICQPQPALMDYFLHSIANLPLLFLFIEKGGIFSQA